jgi:hypothetical protein
MLTFSASSTIFLPILVHVRCKMICSLPRASSNLAISAASSRLLVAVLPPAPHVTLTATGGDRGADVNRWIRSSKLARPSGVRGGKNSKV